MRIFTLSLLSILFLIISHSPISAQNGTLVFDGVDDYVDLGSSAGDDIRTIEMWFKLADPIDATLQDFATLVAREVDPVNNTTEFVLAFQPAGLTNPGTLRFDIDGAQPARSVYSDNNSWNANEWYHVAAVVHPVDGMTLYINGMKQSSTFPYTGATAISPKITALGQWGDTNTRHFKGEIDDLHFSKDALYTSNFTAPCPNRNGGPFSNALWHFNESSGNTAIDSSNNNYDASIVGATRGISSLCIANALHFDGVDDYVDLGQKSGDRLRTIEMWFKLDDPIDATLSDFSTLIAREIVQSSMGTDEFQISFQPSSVTNPGTLRFDVDGTQPFRSVYSDNNSWNANQWYHVAAVIHPVDGMMMFIDGIKQMSTHPHTDPTGTFSETVALGRWGKEPIRYFKGMMDDVHLSTEALYTSNFTPPCPDYQPLASSRAVWNFNEVRGSIATDSSANKIDAQLFGPNRVDGRLCQPGVSNDDLFDEITKLVQVYPNPSDGIFYFEILDRPERVEELLVYNALGQVVLKEKVRGHQGMMDLTSVSNGIYFFRLVIDGEQVYGGKLVKE
jgi:hypothetical protein